MQAMIFAAGLGTRLQPLTNTKPKALVEINDKTLLERNIEKMVAYGIKKIVINIHHFPEMMKEFIANISPKYNCQILISDESEELLNTGGGLFYARNLLNNNTKIRCRFTESISQKNLLKCDNNFTLLHNVDILSDIDFYDMEKEFSKTQPLALLAVKKRETSRYLIFNENNELCGWTNIATNEKTITRDCKQENFYAFSGVHIVNNAIFDKITQRGVFSIIDMYLNLSRNNVIKPYIHNGIWLDVGKLDAVEKAKQMF